VELLASVFVGKPQDTLAVAVVYLALRFMALGIALHPRSLLIASTAWGLYAAWEWLIIVWTPEADIRVDLLVIWPAPAIISAWALFRAFR